MACHPPPQGFDIDCLLLTSETQLLSTVQSTLYGFHTVLYVLCMYILFTRKQNRHRAHCVLVTTIYVAATIGFGLRYAIYSINNQLALIDYSNHLRPLQDQPASGEPYWLKYLYFRVPIDRTVRLLTTIANGVTDVLMLWRCYLMWNHKVWVILVPCLLCVTTSILGLCGAIFPFTLTRIMFALFAFTSNLTLTSLIAGRILSIARRVTCYLPPQSKPRKMYRTIFSATLESGLIYSTILLTYSISVILNHPFSEPEIQYLTLVVVGDVTFDSLMYVMGIASTLIIVRVSLGIAIHDEKTFMETIIRGRESSPADPGAQGVIDICQLPHHNVQSIRETGESDLEAQD
ncbi:hypothetical protein PM082_021999 [Marasmius tenuissimus]|nr:hypothetical protein PM082_021999 [Marasmius tenuissimus]